jgi:hypothetical protein
MNTRHLLPCLCLPLLVATLPGARAEVTADEAKAGRALVKQVADAIVSVEVVATVKVTVGDHAQPPRENKGEENGTVISPTGLTVAVLSAIDPHGAIEAMAATRGGGQKIEVAETEFKDVKLRLANNTEVPAVIVLKDPDLDLVFLAPLPEAGAPARTFPYVDLAKSAKAEVLGNYYFVTRASKSFQRIPIVQSTTVVGIVEKPRRMYLMSQLALGVPIFDPAGLIVGITTPYLENGRPTGHVVLTAEDVAELATQAAAVKAEDKEEKPEADAAPADAKGAPALPVTPAPAKATPAAAKP